jgi:hypothetical protein
LDRIIIHSDGTRFWIRVEKEEVGSVGRRLPDPAFSAVDEQKERILENPS